MIGVFDSGHGGLTVLRALRQRLPDQGFIYFGDHAHAPYGNRPHAEIIELTRAAVERLFARGCRLVIIACNTAAAIALRTLQQQWLPRAHPDRRLLGVLVPMVEAITGVPWMADITAPRLSGPARTVAIFATRGTVRSQAYPREIHKRAPEVSVVQQACPRLASAIEAGAPSEELRKMVATSARGLRRKLGGWPDYAVLGCTHYPLVAHRFRATLPATVTLLDQPALTAESLAHYLERRPEFSRPAPGAPLLLTSGQPHLVSQLATRFIGTPHDFVSVYQPH
jgi:glutamate racemase